jgi:hypothetical protein
MSRLVGVDPIHDNHGIFLSKAGTNLLAPCLHLGRLWLKKMQTATPVSLFSK